MAQRVAIPRTCRPKWLGGREGPVFSRSGWLGRAISADRCGESRPSGPSRPTGVGPKCPKRPVFVFSSGSCPQPPLLEGCTKTHGVDFSVLGGGSGSATGPNRAPSRPESPRNMPSGSRSWPFGAPGGPGPPRALETSSLEAVRSHSEPLAAQASWGVRGRVFRDPSRAKRIQGTAFAAKAVP